MLRTIKNPLEISGFFVFNRVVPALFFGFRGAERTVVRDLATFQLHVRGGLEAHVGVGDPVPALAQWFDPVERRYVGRTVLIAGAEGPPGLGVLVIGLPEV